MKLDTPHRNITMQWGVFIKHSNGKKMDYFNPFICIFYNALHEP